MTKSWHVPYMYREQKIWKTLHEQYTISAPSFPPSAYPIRFSQTFHGYQISLLIFNCYVLQQFKWFTCTILYHYVIKIRMQQLPSNILYEFLHVHHMYVVCFCVVSSPQNPHEWQQVTIYVACCLIGNYTESVIKVSGKLSDISMNFIF